MATGVVTVGRKQYVSGLYWENSPSGRISQAAKEAARQPGTNADFFATRSGNKQGRVPQFGLAPAVQDLRAGMPSIAGCLANQQPGSWIGAFRFREGVALVILRDDLIVPDGDQFFLDETEARDRLYQEMAIGGFQKIYAPEPWGVPGADTMPISLLLNERTDVRVHSLVLSSTAKAGIVLGGLFLLGVMGITWYLQDQAEKEEIARLEREEALRRIQIAARNNIPGMNKPVEYPPPEKVWQKRPRPMEILQACQDSLAKVKVGVAGWTISSLRCSDSGLEINWQRTTGNTAPPPRSVVDPNGGSAASSYPITGLEPRGEETLVDPSVVTTKYLRENWTGQIRREPDDPPPPPPPGHKGEWNPPPPPWVKRSFTISVPQLPWTFPIFMEGLPGVVIKNMAVSGNPAETRSAWRIEGVIYENRR